MKVEDFKQSMFCEAQNCQQRQPVTVQVAHNVPTSLEKNKKKGTRTKH